MTTIPPIVLWVDEDQSQWNSIAWRVAKCGAEVRRAFSVRDGIHELDTIRPSAIILDAIVRLGGIEDAHPFAGQAVWARLDNELQNRTIVLSVVPFHSLVRGINVPEERFFWKGELESNLDKFEDVLRKILNLSALAPAANQNQ